MNLIETGDIFSYKPANISRLDISGTTKVSRFELLFLASPRAKELSSSVNVSSYLSASASFTPKKSNTSTNSPLESTKNNSVFESSDTNLFSPVIATPDSRFDGLRSQVTDVLTRLRTPKSSNNSNSHLNESQRDTSAKDSSRKHSVDLGQDQATVKSRDDLVDENDDEDAESLANGDIENENDEEQPDRNSKNDNDSDDNVANDDIANDFDDEDEDMNIDENVVAKILNENNEEKDENDDDDNDDNKDKDDNDDQDQAQESMETSTEPLPTTPLSTTVKKPHHLSDWCIKAMKSKTSGLGIIVEGQRPEDEPGSRWHSTSIVKRVNAYILETKKKSQYHLEGEIQEDETLQQGFSTAFVKAFKYGFPPNWEHLVKEHFDAILSPPKKVPVTKSKPSKTGRKKNKKAKTPGNSVTPVEVELKRTKSGRLIKPPLAWWRGQRIITDGNHNLTAIEPGSEECTALSVGMYDFDLKLPKDKAFFLQSKLMTPKVAKFDVSPPKENTDKSKRMPSKKFLSDKHSDNMSSSTMPTTDATNDSESKEQSDVADSDSSVDTEKLEKINSKTLELPRQEKTVAARNEKGQYSTSNSPSRKLVDGHGEELSDVDNVKRNISFSDENDSDDGNSKRPSPAKTRQSRYSSSNKENIDTSKKTLRNNRDKKKSNSISQKELVQKQSRRNLRRANTIVVDDKADYSSQDDVISNSRRSKTDIITDKASKDQSELSTEEDKRETRRSKRQKRTKGQKVNCREESEESSEDEDRQTLTTRNQRQMNNKNEKNVVNARTERSKKDRNRKKVNENDHTNSDDSSQEETKLSRQKHHRGDKTITLHSQRGKVRETRSSKNNKQDRQTQEDYSTEAMSQDNELETEHFKRPQNQRRRLTKNSAIESDFSSQDEDDNKHHTLRHNNKHTQQTQQTKQQRTKENKFDNDHIDQNRQTAFGHNSNRRNLRQRDRFKQMSIVCEEEEEEENTTSDDDDDDEDSEEDAAILAMVTKARIRKVQRQIQDQEEEKERAMAKKKPNSKHKKKQVDNKKDGGDDGSGWKEDEIIRFTSALHTIPLSSPRFWHQVSQAVETRTAQECQSKYEEQLEGRPKKESVRTKQQTKPQQKVVAITGGVGTVKRKRELRQLIQQTNDGYDDDIFDSTPFKKSKKSYKIDLEPHSSDDDDDIDEDDNDAVFEEHTSRDFKTPSSRTPSSRFRPLGPGSHSSNTPTGEFISPSLLQPVDRSGMDHYIKRMKQGKRGVYAQTTKVSKTSTPKKKVPVYIPKVNGSIFNVDETPDQDSEEESDDYFSE